jgi:putative ABC transport system permease protein
LISFLIINELSFDRFNSRHKRIFRLIQNTSFGDEEYTSSFTPAVIGPAILNEIPETEDFLRMTKRMPADIECNSQTFTEEHLVEADSSFFNFFSLPVLKGDRGNLLNAPGKIVLSLSTAKKIFGDDDPIDRIIKIGTDTIVYTVSGVMADIPENSHFKANMLLSFMTNPRCNEQVWTNNSFSTYILLKPNTDFRTVDTKIDGLVFKNAGAEIQQQLGISMSDWIARGHKYRYYLQNLTDIHLDPSIVQEFSDAGDPKYLKVTASLAVLIVLIAAINFMNLSTAQASRRAKEVGIKKISGSSRRMLIIQFLSESFILSFISLVSGLIFIKLTLPYFNNLLGANISLNLFSNWVPIPFLILFTLVVGLLAGSYPAFFLSSFNPYEVLKGIVKSSMQNGRLRKVLVVFQFAVSIIMISGTIIMHRQLKYMLNKDLGFNKEQMIVIKNAETLGTKAISFKETISEIPGVISIVSSSAVPGRNNNSIRYKLEGREDKPIILETNFIDYDYLDTYGFKVISGRTFNESFVSDEGACLVNESAVKEFGLTNPDATRFTYGRSPDNPNYLKVIGVVKDFHFKSLHSQIGPYMFRLNTKDFPVEYLSVKLSAGNYSQSISGIENQWKEFTGNKPFQYYFVDDNIEEKYSQEKQNARIAIIFSILAIFIASLGLFGLTSFAVGQRIKEIGVRKAMGSSVSGIYMVISREFIILVSISSLIAFPVVYYISVKWLESFYYRISPGVLSFAAGFAIASGIAILTISYRIIRAARINPAQSLKYE